MPRAMLCAGRGVEKMPSPASGRRARVTIRKAEAKPRLLAAALARFQGLPCMALEDKPEMPSPCPGYEHPKTIKYWGYGYGGRLEGVRPDHEVPPEGPAANTDEDSLMGEPTKDDQHTSFEFLQLAEEESQHLWQRNRSLEVNPVLRTKLVDFIMQQCVKWNCRQTTLFLAVQLLDRALPYLPKQSSPEILAATSLLLASKFEETFVESTAEPYLSALSLSLEVEAWVGDNGSVEDIQEMEIDLFNFLDCRLNLPTPAMPLHFFLSFLEVSDKNDRRKLRMLTSYLAELGLQLAQSASWLPTLHACAAAILAGQLLKRPKHMQFRLEKVCQAAAGQRHGDELKSIIMQLALSAKEVTKSQWFNHIVSKYSSSTLNIAEEASGLVTNHLRDIDWEEEPPVLKRRTLTRPAAELLARFREA